MLWRGLGYLPCLHTGTAAVPSVAERPQRRSQLQELLTLKTGLHTKRRRARSNLSISILLTTAIVATGSTMFVLDRARATAPSLGWAWSGSMRFAFRPPWCSWCWRRCGRLCWRSGLGSQRVPLRLVEPWQEVVDGAGTFAAHHCGRCRWLDREFTLSVNFNPRDHDLGQQPALRERADWQGSRCQAP